MSKRLPFRPPLDWLAIQPRPNMTFTGLWTRFLLCCGHHNDILFFSFMPFSLSLSLSLCLNVIKQFTYENTSGRVFCLNNSPTFSLRARCVLCPAPEKNIFIVDAEILEIEVFGLTQMLLEVSETGKWKLFTLYSFRGKK